MGVWNRIVPDYQKKFQPLFQSKWKCHGKSKYCGQQKLQYFKMHHNYLRSWNKRKERFEVSKTLNMNRKVIKSRKNRFLIPIKSECKERKIKSDTEMGVGLKPSYTVNSNITQIGRNIDKDATKQNNKAYFYVKSNSNEFVQALKFILNCIRVTEFLLIVVIINTCMMLANKALYASFDRKTIAGIPRISNDSKSVKQTWIKQFLYGIYLKISQSVETTLIVYPAWKSQSSSITNMSSVEPGPNTSSMENEMMRLSTFSNFPSESSMSSIRASRAGFIYEGNSDEITCFSCGLRLRTLNFRSNIMQLHREHAISCRFINSYSTVDSDSVSRQESESNATVCTDVCGGESPSFISPLSNNPDSSLSAAGEPTNLTAVHYASKYDIKRFVDSHGYYSDNVTTENKITLDENDILKSITQITYPEYKYKKIRRSTYINWTILFLNPDDLSDCGLFHTNFEDCVRCFCCGIGLRNWESDDNPWIEHARWSPKCEFLILKKSFGFIENVFLSFGIEKDCAVDNSAVAKPITKQDPTSKSPSSALNNLLHHEHANFIITEKIFTVDQVENAMLSLDSKIDLHNISRQMLIDTIIDQQQASDSSEANFKTPEQSTITFPHAWHEHMRASDTAMHTKQEKNLLFEDAEKIKKEMDDLQEMFTCKICLDEKVSITFIPCGHLVSCNDCSPKLKKCPLCRTFIKSTIKTKI